MYSASMPIAPEAANPVVEITVMVVAEEFNAPLSVVEADANNAPPKPPAPQPVKTAKISAPIEIWYVSVAAPVMPEEVAGEGTVMLKVALFKTVMRNSWFSAAAGMPFTAPATPEIVTKSPVLAPCPKLLTVTVVEPFTVVNALDATVTVLRIGVMSLNAPPTEDWM